MLQLGNDKHMAHLWNKTIEIDIVLAKKLIESQFQLSISHITLLDEGWDNTVFLVNHEWVFRFPHRPFGVSCMENEIAMLPFVAPHLSFQASIPFYTGKASELFPYPFCGYRLIQGKPLCDATVSLVDNPIFAKTLAKWLRELNHIPVSGLDNTDSSELRWQFNVPHRIKRCYENLTQYEKYFLSAGFSASSLTDIIEKISEFKLHNTKQSILHGDLYCRHVIVDEHLSPTGLIDFGDIFIGDPGIDLSIVSIFSEKLFDVFLDAYGDVDRQRLELLLFHSFAHAMSFLSYAYEQQKPSLQCWAGSELKRSMDELKKLK